MNDLTISHRIQADRNGPRGACVWCGQTTDVWAITPFRPDLGRVPLHLFCGVWMRDAFKAWKAGQTLDTEQMEGMRRLSALPQIGSGQ